MIIDGQQRLTALYSVFRDKFVKDENYQISKRDELNQAEILIIIDKIKSRTANIDEEKIIIGK